MVPIAREGLREIALATVVCAGLAIASAYLFWPLALVFAALWLWVLAFFRDPPRRRDYAPGELCAPADGRVTEIAELSCFPPIEGPVVRIGIFLSLFNVHVNRFPCAVRVVSTHHQPGLFLDARHPESGLRNESNTLVLEPAGGMPGPIILRQVAGLVARRIISHAAVGQEWPAGGRFGMIKFGSRTELIIPRLPGTEICVAVGDRVKGGLTIMARQPLSAAGRESERDRQVRRTPAAATP